MPGIWAVDRLGRRSLLMIGAVWVLFLLFFFELFLNRSWSSKSNLTFFLFFFVLSFFGFDLQAVMCICQLIVAILGLVVSNSNISGQHALVAFVCIFIGGFASTWVSVSFFLSPYQSSLCVCVCLVTASSTTDISWNLTCRWSWSGVVLRVRLLGEPLDTIFYIHSPPLNRSRREFRNPTDL